MNDLQPFQTPPPGAEVRSTPAAVVAATPPSHRRGLLIVGGLLVLGLLGAGAWWLFVPRFVAPTGPQLALTAPTDSQLNQEVATNGQCFSGYQLAAYGDPKKPFIDLTLTMANAKISDEPALLHELVQTTCADEQKEIMVTVLKVTKLASPTDSRLAVMYRSQGGQRFILPVD